eukprot:2472761-Lingulodinium_polyedra.AAC.1
MDLQSLAAGSEATMSDDESQFRAGSEADSMHPYHRTKKGSRAFRLIAMQGCSEAVIAQLQKTKCELCGLSASSEDPLYPGYFREWAYYPSKSGPRLIASRACDRVPIDH